MTQRDDQKDLSRFYHPDLTTLFRVVIKKVSDLKLAN